jgi:hypothetical protein
MHLNTKNLVGNSYGRLTVISMSNERGLRGQIKWNCLCSCGISHVVTGESLRSGKSKSCGCLLYETRYARNDKSDRAKALLKIEYHSLTKRHKNKFKNNEFISFDEFRKITSENCFYCGIAPSRRQDDIRYENRRNERLKIKVTDDFILINGIDRVDSSIGYVSSNVVACCKNCNTAKNTLSVIEFKNLINRIYQHWSSK